MHVKGIVYLTGKTNLIEAFGEERWNFFMTKLVEKDKFFSNVIMSVTPIPVEKFILFLDVMIEEFFNNDMMQYVTIGNGSSQIRRVAGRSVQILSAHKGCKSVCRVGHA